METPLLQNKHRAVYRDRSRIQDEKIEGVGYREFWGGREIHPKDYGEAKKTPVASSSELSSNPRDWKLFQHVHLLNTSNVVRHIFSTWPKLYPFIQVSPQCTKAIVFLSIVTPVLADGGDEFANNLFSDLAPLLALFGEQVAKQFLSESTSWADNILFAMAPLGIITAIVSAIRVAGFSWLKAVVGRSKEGQGQVELELMSSNSHDVGELWNGQAVVRVIGTPSVFQLVYDPKIAISDPANGIDVLRNGNPFFGRVSKANRPDVSLGEAPGSPDRDEEEGIELDILWDENYDTPLARLLIPTSSDNSYQENSLIPPNISLNARGEPVTNLEKWVYAIIGVVLQMVVLAYGAVISYHPHWKNNQRFLKNGISPAVQSFPCTAVGTVSVNIGMLICAYVIERASAEDKWTIKDHQNCQVAWVQKGGTVNDQVFEPYIILGHAGQKVIRTSHRCNTATAASLRYLILVGTFVSIFGFVVQFIGLRGMTWSATIAQLVATAIMTILRSVVRRRLIKEPLAELAVEGYELEYMARKIGGCSDWEVVPRYLTVEDELREMSSAESGGERIGGKGDETESEDEGTESEGQREVVDKRLADQVLQICKRLGALSQWSTDVENVSRSLCNAMEQVMTVIFRSKEVSLRDGVSQGLEFTWGLMVRTFEDRGSGADCTALNFKLERSQSWAAWEVTNETRNGIKCVLSLWMLHFLEKEREYQHKRQRNATALGEGELNDSGGVVRVLSWPTHPVDYEIARLWLGRGLDIRVSDLKAISQEEKVPRHRFIGGADHYENAPMLAIIHDTSVIKQLGQEVFSQFFSAVVPLIDEISGSTETHEHQSEIEGFENTALSQIMDAMLGVGTRPEILLCERFLSLRRDGQTLKLNIGIIPHLGNQQLLLMQQQDPGTSLWYSRIDCRHRRSRLGHLWLDTALNIKELLVTSLKTLTTTDQYEILKMAERFRKRAVALAEAGGLKSQLVGRKQLSIYFNSMTSQRHRFSPGGLRSEQPFPVLLTHSIDSGPLEHILAICCQGPQPQEDADEIKDLKKYLVSNTNSRDELLVILRNAAERGYDSIVEALIDRKLDTRDTDQTTQSALVLSSSRGNTTVVRQLLDNHMFNFPNDYRQFQVQHLPLYLLNAAYHGHTTTLSLLLEYIKPLYKPKYQETALILAAGRGHIDMVKELLNHGADPDSRGARLGDNSQSSLFIKSTKSDVLDRAEWTDNGELKEESQKALAKMGKGDYQTVIKSLLVQGNHVAATVAITVRTALEAAAEAGHDAIVEHLLGKGAKASVEISRRYWLTALQAAARGGHITAVERLFMSQAEVNQRPSDFFGRSALQGAAEKGHTTMVDVLLGRGADVNAEPARFFGRTALQASAESGHLEIVERMLAEGAIIDQKPSSVAGRTALQAAASRGHLAVTKSILLRGADVNAKPADFYGRTALQGASEGGYLELVDLLLEKRTPTSGINTSRGADVNANPARYFGLTALQAAAKEGHLEIVDRLLEKGANVNAARAVYFGLTALQAAAKGGHLAVVERLLEEGAHIHKDIAEHWGGLTSLQAAAKGGHLVVVNRLLEKRDNVNLDPARYSGLTALQAAAQGGHLIVVDRLLEKGANVNADPARYFGLTALQAAAKYGHLSVVDCLLEKGANVNADQAEAEGGLTALQAAAKGGHLVVVDRLLEKGANVNADPATGEWGLTALQAAAKEGHLIVVDRLLEKGANINARPAGSSGLTALQAASKEGHLVVVDRLLEKGANVNADPAGGGGGLTALQAAAKYGHLVVVDRLLEKGANVNAPLSEHGGLTALQAAARGGHLAVVDHLLEKGADVNAPLSEHGGLTALQAAARGGHLVVVDRLLEKGANVNANPAGSGVGLTALQAAAKYGHLVVVDRLLGAGANVNADRANPEHQTALQAAAKGGHSVVVDRLLEKGAIVDHTAITNAKNGGYHTVAQLLVRKYAKASLEKNTSREPFASKKGAFVTNSIPFN